MRTPKSPLRRARLEYENVVDALILWKAALSTLRTAENIEYVRAKIADLERRADALALEMERDNG